MHVRKFYGDSLEETLQSIKRELGPDAIILKTVNNKGLKGAFKKNRIEITAAISEKSYIKKANVDQSLPDDMRDQFYSSDAGHISKMINNNSRNMDREPTSVGGGYGNLGLNRSVKMAKSESSSLSSSGHSLDDFLGEESSVSPTTTRTQVNPRVQEQPLNREEIFTAPQKEVKTERITDREVQDAVSKIQENYEVKIDELEAQIFELSQQVSKLNKVESVGIRQMRALLQSMSIDNLFIQQAILKLTAELSDSDLENSDIVFEAVLKDMAERIKTELPLFSQVDVDEYGVITLLLSETSCGQTSTMLKLGSLLENSLLISYSKDKKGHIAENLYSMNVINVNSVSEIVSHCRKAMEKKQSVIIDYQSFGVEVNEIKKLIDGLRRSFEKVEVLITLSSLHSELYNTKVVNTFRQFADGVIITFLDMCMNFGSIFNICSKSENLPLKFYSTGDVVPDDLEGATKERILAGIFKLV